VKPRGIRVRVSSFGYRLSGIGALLLLPFSPPANAQHALTADSPLPAELEGCNLCHGPHTSGGRGEFILRQGGKASLETAVAGLDRSSGSCLRCHMSPSLRAVQPEFEQVGLPLSGGAYLEADFSNDHPLGSIDPGGILAEHSASAVLRPGLSGTSSSLLTDGGTLRIGCTTCHDPHDRSGALPSLEAERQLCESCHDPSRYSYEGHAILPCSGCHAVHEGHGKELFSRPTGDEVCNGCHAPGAAVADVDFRALASRRARLYGAVGLPSSSSGHLVPPEGRCVDCHPVHR